MARKWFFQANPKLYDVDGALANLDEIWWRVPQYTAEIHQGDVVLIWRSGTEAGIVGVGRVAAEPQQHAISSGEEVFVIDPEIAGVQTRALLRVRPTKFVSKEQVLLVPGFGDHSIIRAPMGTVIPVEDAGFALLESLVDSPPEVDVEAISGLPLSLAWEQRSKSAHPLPGGYEGYLDSLAELLLKVKEKQPVRADLPELVRQLFAVTPAMGEHIASFVRKVWLVVDRGEVVDVSDWAEAWLETKNHRIVVALLHSRVRFIGEMLDVLQSPKTSGELLEIANGPYGCSWSTKAQIDRRRGWLQSAGMLTVDEANRLATTDAGRSMVSQLTLYSPGPWNDALAPEIVVAAAQTSGPVAELPVLPEPVSEIVAEMRDSSLASSDPDRFERAVRDAFSWLGFQAEWLGGSGQTDVLLDAPLGKAKTYRVIVDCKTSGSGSVLDSQVDWDTLVEHRKKHDAQYVAVVAPSPSGKRLFQRASDHGVSLVSVDELASLCVQHASAPLDLEAYRLLFASGGPVSTAEIAELAEEWLQVVRLAGAVINLISNKQELVESLTARDLRLLMIDSSSEVLPQEDIQGILDTLASPLLQILSGTKNDGYRLVTPRLVAQERFRVLAALLLSSSSA